ncbi:MAG TPA: hypothetical protein VF815_15240 [Myxococcaceae bacterium]
MRWLLPLLTLLSTLGSFQRAVASDAHAPPVPSVVEGRVVDEAGVGVAGMTLGLMDTTRLSGHVDSQGCGTYHPSEVAYTDSNGRFRAELSFTPNVLEVHHGPEDFDWPRDNLPVTAGQPIEVKVRRIAWVTYEGQVVDEQGAPVAGANIETGAKTDETGHFKLKLDPEDKYEQLRFRKIGFKPVMVPLAKTAWVQLRERRTLITVKLVDTGTKQPAVQRLYRVEAYRGNERISYCTAGDPKLTHEPAEGECTLDAEPGQLELKVDLKVVRKLRITNAPQTLTFEVPPTEGIR